jgi:two-component system, NarL family, nitrate/nitrite response regulator NarL
VVADLRILIVADDPLARTGLAALLEAQPGCAIAGQTPSGPADHLSGAVETYQPDLVLWDLGWNPEPAVEHLAAFRPGRVPVAALLPGAALAAQASAAWSAGARALLSRNSDGPHLAAALLALAQGFSVLDPEVAAFGPGGQSPAPEGGWQAGEVPALAEDLTPRELEVLRLLAEGLPNKAIAHRLGISEHTAKFHVNAILGKLGVQSRTEAVVRATRLGLVLL